MGGDGGSIPGRTDLVRTKQRSEQKDKEADLAAKWRLCAISQEPLLKPIVACQLGRLYNKETILEFLLDRGKFTCADSFDHITSLKDVRELTLFDNPESGINGAADFICPIVGIEMNGKHKFGFSLQCGCVLSERAIKTIQKDNCCIKCGVEYADLIMLNADGQELETQTEQMNERKEKRRAAKKRKGTARDKKTKHSKTDDVDKAKSKTIQDDPNASKVFKSLFTTSEAAKNQKTGHWVTFNPQYF